MDKDLTIIGGGPAGSVAAARCAESGLEVSLIEKGLLGGTCLNVGCCPSKAILTVSNLVHRAENSKKLGIEASVDVNYKKTLDWKDKFISKIRKALQNTLEKENVEIKRGKASFVSSDEVKITNENGEESIKSKKIMIASGSKPIELPGFPFDHEKVLDSSQFFELKQLPERIAIVGAGYIGMELGTVCAKLGTDVTIIEMTDQILPGWDKQLMRPLAKKSKKLGIDFHFGLKASELKTQNGETLVLAESKDGETKEIPTDKCLVTVGRKPLTEDLNLENTNVNLTENGFIQTNKSLQTEDSNIYAIGDVAGEPMLAHKAFRDATIASNSILEKEIPPSQNIPSVVFTDPQIAHVGTSPDQLEKSDYKIGKASFRSIGASYTKDKTDGFARILVDKDTNVVLGGDIVGPNASEIIHELGIIVENELTIEDILDTVHTHPTLSEIITKAAEDAGDTSPYSL